VCSTSNRELVRSLGANHVIDYTEEDFTRGERRYDVILDNVMNHPPSATARVLTPTGTLIPNSIGNKGGFWAGLPRLARAAVTGRGSDRCTVPSAASGARSPEGGADASGYVWPGRDGGPMSADSPGQALERVCDRAGLVENPKPARAKSEAPRPFVSFHGLRHTAASIVLAGGVPLLVVSRQLGHRNPNVTAEVYAHLLHDAQLDEAMSAFGSSADLAGDIAGEPATAANPPPA
jgi:hypothetical protein